MLPPKTKKCPKCTKVLPSESFGISNSRSTGLQYYCKPCMKIHKKEHREKNPEKYQAYRRKWRYGIPLDAYDILLKEQEGLCAICKERKKLVLDHDHSTGEIRGLLCANCNLGIGNMKDSILILTSAIEYLGMVRHFTS